MKVFVIGAGFTGGQLVRTLVAEGCNVVLIDRDAERVRQARNQLDCTVIQSDGNSLAVLEEAGIASADALVTLTEDDEINMITCSLVDAVYPKVLKIARVRNYAYYAGAAATARVGNRRGTPVIRAPGAGAQPNLVGPPQDRGTVETGHCGLNCPTRLTRPIPPVPPCALCTTYTRVALYCGFVRSFRVA